MTIRIEQGTYSPSESEALFSVCAVLDGQTAVTVPITLTPVSMVTEFSAQGKNVCVCVCVCVCALVCSITIVFLFLLCSWCGLHKFPTRSFIYPV